MSDFVHLHNHTDFSLLDGAASISKYIAKLKEQGMTKLAITDHGNMFGALKFYKAMKKEGLEPIIGCEFYCNPEGRKLRPAPGAPDRTHRYHLILLAMNNTGYKNLMALNTLANVEGYYYKPRIDDELLEKYNEGLICTSACLGGEILQMLLQNQYDRAKERALWFKSVFGDRYYIELQDHGLEQQKQTNPLLVKIARECDIPLVCTNDIHYINKDDANAHDILLCIGTNSKKSDERRMRFPTQEFYFKTEEQMKQIFSWCPEAIANTKVIADRCNLEIEFPGPLLPIVDPPEGFDNIADYLRYLAEEGLKVRYEVVTPELVERLNYELGIIIKMHFEGYFLIVRDYIHWAKMHGISVGPGRGSGAGSLVAYCITITDVDPIKYKLIFERFLNPERVSMPDFDVDFCFERREEVIQYVTEHYGKDRVAQIATFGTLKAKAVVKDCARALDIPYDEANRICKYIPDEPKMTLEKAFAASPELGELEAKGGVYAELFDVARRLEGLNRNTSTHACGIVIGQKELINYVPLTLDPKTGSVATQYTMDLIEECGLVKMDFLGLKTLTLIKHAEELIQKRVPDFDISKVSDEDQKTFDMLSRGDSTCVFQFESAGMQKILRDAQPNTMEDLVALNALYRPGPMAYIPQFINCKHGRQPITYADPDLEDDLKTTYGVIVYQEQVMRVAQIIAGYSLGQADILRRIMGKKKVDQLEAQKKVFIEGAAKNGKSEQHAIEIFEMLEPFAGYGFNKSHAVAYSVVAYRTAYLKANYPAEFMAANLTNEINSPDKFSEYLQTCADMGIDILPPNINYSEKHFSVVDGKIVYGLAGIKNVGENAVESIVREREENGKYRDFVDFVMRNEGKVLNSRLLESLIKAGTFDSICINRPTLMENMNDVIAFAHAQKEAYAYGQNSLFEDDLADEINTFSMVEYPDWTQMEKLESEKQFLGFYVSGHPLDVYKEQIKKCVSVDLSKPEKLPTDKEVQIIAMVMAMKQHITKKGDKMGFFTLMDHNGSIEAVMFPRSYEKYKETVVKDGIYGFIGKISAKDDDAKSMIINEVVDPDTLPPKAFRNCHILINKSISSTEAIEQLRDLCIDYRGKSALDLQFCLEDGGSVVRKIVCGVDFGVDYSEDFIREAKEIFSVLDVWFD